jgi:hypothetical protein
MNIYSIQYKDLDSKDIRRILNDYEALVLPAKKALLKHIEEFPEKEEFNPNKIDALKVSIAEETERIKNLEYLDWLGIGVLEKPDEIFIKRNKMAKSRDRWAIFIGVFLTIFFLLPAIGSFFDMLNEFEASKLISTAILGIIGGLGTALLVKSLDRSLSLKKFRLRKNSREIILKSSPETYIKNETYPLDTQLITKQFNGDIYLALQQGNGEVTIDLIKFSKLEPVLLQTLEDITVKFNNWSS